MKFCVVGYGTVGKAVCAGLDKVDEFDYIIVDNKGEHRKTTLRDNVASCDAAIICISTPLGKDDDGNDCLDDSGVMRTINKINTFTESPIPILLKSTVNIQTLADFKQRGLTNVCYSPEFLRNDSSVEDFLSETKFIIGGDMEQSQGWANIFSQFQPIKDEAFLDIVEAGIVKLAENAFLAMRVTFFNDLYNFVEGLEWTSHGPEGEEDFTAYEVDYDSIVYALGLDDRIGHSHNQVPGPDGKYGWAGHCLPKDTTAFLEFSKILGTPLKLLEYVIELNKHHRFEQLHGEESRKECNFKKYKILDNS
jgi:UDPglucose 6-dehydrogenase